MTRRLKSILLVDDDEASNYIVERILRKADIADDIIAVTNGQEALDFLADNEPPDLLFLDINMPAMNGWEFIEKFDKRGDAERARTVVVMLTTSSNPDDKARADALPTIRRFLEKPLQTDEVDALVEQHFPAR